MTAQGGGRKQGEATTAKEKLGQLWQRVSRRRRTTSNSNSQSRRRVVEVIPIACTTKRTDSVLAENYLFPIEPEDDHTTNQETNNNTTNNNNKGQLQLLPQLMMVQKSRPSRRSVFASLGLKTKIGPMDLGVIANRNNNHIKEKEEQKSRNKNNNATAIKNSTSSCVVAAVCSGDQHVVTGGKPLLLLGQQTPQDADGGGFDEQVKMVSHSELNANDLKTTTKMDLNAPIQGGELPSNDNFKNINNNNNLENVSTTPLTPVDAQLLSLRPPHQVDQGPPSPVEVEALRLLNNWGISNAMLAQASSSGARNELVGIYRIVVHRLQMQQERQQRSNSSTKEEEALLVGGRKKSEKMKKNGDGSDGGGGCGGKCSATSCVIL